MKQGNETFKTTIDAFYQRLLPQDPHVKKQEETYDKHGSAITLYKASFIPGWSFDSIRALRKQVYSIRAKKDDEIMLNDIQSLSKAIVTFHQKRFPKRHISHFPKSDPFFQFYDSVQHEKKKRVFLVLGAQENSAVATFLKNTIERLHGTDKGRNILDAVAEKLVELEKTDQTSKIYQDQDRQLSEAEAKVSYTSFSDKKPENMRISNVEGGVGQWLSKLYADSNDHLMTLLAKHQNPISGKETRSMRELTVAVAKDLMTEKKDVYGKEFIEIFDQLSPSSEKAFAVAKALIEWDSSRKFRSETMHSDFVEVLKNDEQALTKALKMRSHIPRLFGESKTWQTILMNIINSAPKASI